MTDTFSAFGNTVVTNISSVFTHKSALGQFRYSSNLHGNELIFKFSGKSEIDFGGKHYREAENNIRFLPSGDYTPNPYDVDVNESGDCIDIIFDTALPINSDVFVRSIPNPKPVAKLFKHILSEWQLKNSGYRNRCIAYLYEIFSLLESQTVRYIPSEKYEKILAGITYVEQHFCDSDFDFAKPSELCGISQVYFNRVFKEKFGQSVIEYIQTRKIDCACDLLKSGMYSVTEIAFRCGFPDIYYFSRVFKKKVGVAPSRYVMSI